MKIFVEINIQKAQYYKNDVHLYALLIWTCIHCFFLKFRQTILPDKMNSFINNLGQRKPKPTADCGKMPNKNPACDQLPSNEDKKLLRGYVTQYNF